MKEQASQSNANVHYYNKIRICTNDPIYRTIPRGISTLRLDNLGEMEALSVGTRVSLSGVNLAGSRGKVSNLDSARRGSHERRWLHDHVLQQSVHKEIDETRTTHAELPHKSRTSV